MTKQQINDGNGKLSWKQIGELCELHIGQGKSITALSLQYNVTENTIKRYLDKYYYGIVPKEKQTKITITNEEI